VTTPRWRARYGAHEVPTFDPRQVFRRRLTEPMEQLAQAVAERVVQLVIDAIDVNQLIDRVDVDRLIERVDVNQLLAGVDVNEVVRRVDVEQVVERVDVDAIVARVDVEALLARVDVEALVERIDVNRLVEKIDVSALVSQTDLGRVLAASTTGVVTGVLDLVRSHLASLDQGLERVLTALFHERATRPLGPGMATTADTPAAPGQRRQERDVALQGRYAGPFSRLADAAADFGAGLGIFNVVLAALSFAWRVVTGHDVSFNHHPLVVDPILAVWSLIYLAYPWALSGKSLGMAVIGIRVVTPDRGRIKPGRAVLRALVLPVSIALAGLGLVGIVVQRQRRALHDFAAGSVVIYDWNARAARLRAMAGSHRDSAPAPETAA
jgi:uncharacterized RDD family membrane protein YckC